MDLTDVFPPGPYQFRLGIRRGEISEFFRARAETPRALAERRQWLAGNPPEYLAVLPKAEPLLEETIAILQESGCLTEAPRASEPSDRLRMLSEQFDPDLVLLAPLPGGAMRVVAGALCFPTAWRLQDKLGREMTFVHEPVPGLNAQLGQQIGTALAKLRPGAAWLRSNWSLTATDELNQHPDRRLPRLSGESRLENTWLRVERQALIALPKSLGVLFAIRIESERLDRLCAAAPESTCALAEALQTMPDEVAAYKGIAPAREALLAVLTRQQGT